MQLVMWVVSVASDGRYFLAFLAFFAGGFAFGVKGCGGVFNSLRKMSSGDGVGRLFMVCHG
jgi:hypothetical protein